MASISRGLRFLPLVWSLLLIINVISSRLIAYTRQLQVSERSSRFLLVESTFSELLDLLALVGLASIMVRYLHLEMVTHDLVGEFHSSVSRLRLASLSFGVGSMMGITVISNFRHPSQQVSRDRNVLKLTGKVTNVRLKDSSRSQAGHFTVLKSRLYLTLRSGKD